MANESYSKAGTTVRWTDTTGDLAMTLNNLADGAGRQGAEKDYGVLTTARPTLYHYRVYIEWEAGMVVGDIVDFYIKGGDGTEEDNDDGTADAAVSVLAKLRNLRHIRSIYCDEAVANIPTSLSGYFRSYDQTLQPVLFNLSAAATAHLDAANNVSWIDITPVYEQVQA